jgi:hypothetical protein
MSDRESGRNDDPEVPATGETGVGDAPATDTPAGTERRRDRRRRRLSRRITTAFGLLSLGIAASLFGLTQTRPGRDLVFSYLEGALRSQIQGDVEIGSVLRGNLLTRVVLERFVISGADGTPFVALDTVRLEYDPLSLVRGQLRFRSMEATRAEIVLRELPDGTWNFARIFGDTAVAGEFAEEPPDTVEGVVAADSVAEDSVAGDDELTGEVSDGLRLIFSDAVVGGGRLEIRRPWTEGLEGRARGAAIRSAQRGETIWRLERFGGQSGEEAYEQVFAIDSLRGTFPLIRILDAQRPLRVEMRGLSGRLEAVRQPLDVGRYDGSVTFGDTIRVELDRLDLGSSALQGSGWVEPGSPLIYQFELAADPVGFADLQWLPVPVPERGGGPMGITLRSRDDVMVVDIRDGAISSGDTRISGGFTLALEPTPRFESLALGLTPLRLQWLDRLLGRPELIDGYVRGDLTGSGRIDALLIDADVELSDVGGSVPPSRLHAVGGVALVEPYPLHELGLEFVAFEPRWAEYLSLGTGLPGRIDGTATLERRAGGALGFRGEISHVGEGGDVSTLSGGGGLDLQTGSAINVSVFADPLALSMLRPFLPDADLVGVVRGPIRATGALNDLQASVDLETPRGQLRFNGQFDVTADDPTYDAEVVADGVELDQWIETAPASKLAVRGRVVGRGMDPATLAASFDLEILPSVFEQARIDTSLVRFTVANALAVVDTFAIRSDVGRVQGRGEFGLSEAASGELVLEATVPDLTRWNRWILDEIPGAAVQEGTEDLFADLAVAGAADENAPIEGLAGSFVATGVASGNVRDFSVQATVTAIDPRYERLGAATLDARVEVADPLVRDSLTLDLAGTGVDLFGHAIDSLSMRFQRRGPGPASLTVDARRDSTLRLSSSGHMERTEDRFALAFDRLRILLGSGESVLQGPTRVAYGNAGLSVDGLRLTGSLGGLAADGVIPVDEPGRMEVRLDGLDLVQLAQLFSRPPDLSGTADGEITLTGTLGDPEMSGGVHVHSPVFRTTEYDSLEARFDYSGRRLEGELVLLDANHVLAMARGEVRTDLALHGVERRLLDDPFDIEIRADSLPLELMLLPVRSLEEIDGRVEATMTIAGAPGSLQYGGSARIVDGTAWVPDLGVRYRAAEGSARFRGSEARIDAFQLRSQLGGTATLSGTVDFASVTDPVFDLDLLAERLHAIDRRDMTVAVEGTGHLGGSYRAPMLEGRYRIRDGDIRQDEFLRERQVIDLGDPSIFSLIDTTGVAQTGQLDRFRNPFMRNLRVSAIIDLGPNLWLRSDVLGVEMVGEGLTVNMDRASESLLMVGTVELARGTYRFDRLPPYSQQLRITAGTIQFVGNPDLNPNIAITAEYRTRTRDGPVVVTTHIGGTLRSTELTLSSSPPMSDSNQLCFLAVGAPCYGSADQRFGERLVQEGVLGTLSSGLSSALVGASGLSYFNLRSVGGTRETAPGAQGSQSLFDNTELELGWYAGEELFFAVTQPLGGGVPSAAMEWRFTENWTLEARAQNRFEQQQYGLFRGTNIANDQTFGLFLFREWTF